MYNIEQFHDQIALHKDNRIRKKLGTLIMFLIWLLLNVTYFIFWRSLLNLILAIEPTGVIQTFWFELTVLWLLWQPLMLTLFMMFASSTHDELLVNTYKKEITKKDNFLFFDRQRSIPYLALKHIGFKKNSKGFFIGYLVIRNKDYVFVKDHVKTRALKKCHALADKLKLEVNIIAHQN